MIHNFLFSKQNAIYVLFLKKGKGTNVKTLEVYNVKTLEVYTGTALEVSHY